VNKAVLAFFLRDHLMLILIFIFNEFF